MHLLFPSLGMVPARAARNFLDFCISVCYFSILKWSKNHTNNTKVIERKRRLVKKILEATKRTGGSGKNQGFGNFSGGWEIFLEVGIFFGGSQPPEKNILEVQTYKKTHCHRVVPPRLPCPRSVGFKQGALVFLDIICLPSSVSIRQYGRGIIVLTFYHGNNAGIRAILPKKIPKSSYFA